MNVSRADVERMLEHAGDMCLLDCTTEWDNQNIYCSAPAPQAGHPLMRDGRVPAIAGVEYAAQAAALHGALLDTAMTPRAGMLAKLRDITLHRPWFPASKKSLMIHAKLISRTDGGCMYSFEVTSEQQTITSGSLMVVFTAQT
jgi:predicted hotdog family 3-hydroxylacyl-ACP dehydratase